MKRFLVGLIAFLFTLGAALPEILIVGAIVSVACATSPDRPPVEPIPAVVVGRRTEPPQRGGDIRYFLSVEFDDVEGIHRSEEVEVDWREYLFFGTAREACAIAAPGRITRLIACPR